MNARRTAGKHPLSIVFPKAAAGGQGADSQNCARSKRNRVEGVSEQMLEPTGAWEDGAESQQIAGGVKDSIKAFQQADLYPFLWRFEGRPISEFICIEVFAGTARLSKAAYEAGFQAVAVDHQKQRAEGHSITIFDLAVQQQLVVLLEFIKENQAVIVWIHLAPPCGTASRARDRKLKVPKHLQSLVPGPLRSEDRPDGLDGLRGADKKKTELANQLYDAVFEIASLAHSLSIFFSVENPTNSRFWKTSPMCRLEQEIDLWDVRFHNCCHG